MTHQSILLEYFFAFGRQFNRQNSDLPPVIAPPDASAQRAPKDLVPKADTNDADAVLLQHFLRKLNKLQNPGIVVEGIVFCKVSPLNTPMILRCEASCLVVGRSVLLDPLIKTASISSRFGYSCAVTHSKALSSKSFLGSNLSPEAAFSSNVVKMRSYAPYSSTTCGGGVSHWRIAIRSGVFIVKKFGV
jgi:hypothetical protein